MDSDDFELVEVSADVPLAATFGVRINGDSMEPDYPDGGTAWVQRRLDLLPGQVGIFVLNGEGFIKKLGDGELLSLNPDYPPIVLTETDDLRAFGLVVGVTV